MSTTANATRERPIPLRDWEVRAILGGTKTQLRRPVKRPSGGLSTVAKFCLKGKAYPDLYAWVDGHPDDIETWGVVGEPMRCPFGRPGDRLWCRETWALAWPWVDYESGHVEEYNEWRGPMPKERPAKEWQVLYAADSDDIDHHPDDRWIKRYRPGIHMPRWASRLTLEVAELRAERLGEMTPFDAGAEGIRLVGGDAAAPWYGVDGEPLGPSPVEAFARLWDAAYGKTHPWDPSLWVWVIRLPEGRTKSRIPRG